MHALGAGKVTNDEMLKFVLGLNLDMEYEDYDGCTAVFNAHSKFLEFLLQNGANIEHRDNFGNTPFFSTCCQMQWDRNESDFQKDIEDLEFFLKYGANINVLVDGETILDVLQRTPTEGFPKGLILPHGYEDRARSNSKKLSSWLLNKGAKYACEL